MDAPFLDVKKKGTPGKGDRRLAAAARSDQRDALAGRDVRGPRREHGRVPPRRVGEVDVAEGHGRARGAGRARVSAAHRGRSI